MYVCASWFQELLVFVIVLRVCLYVKYNHKIRRDNTTSGEICVKCQQVLYSLVCKPISWRRNLVTLLVSPDSCV